MPLGFPPGYLLSSPSVALEQQRQRWRRVKIVCFENRAASAGNIGKGQVVVQKSLDSGLVGPVEHCAARPSPARHFIAQPQRGDSVEVGRLEIELEARLPVET